MPVQHEHYEPFRLDFGMTIVEYPRDWAIAKAANLGISLDDLAHQMESAVYERRRVELLAWHNRPWWKRIFGRRPEFI